MDTTTSSQITIDTFNQLATAYQTKFMDLDLYDDTYDAFCQLIPKPLDGGSIAIFEVGCGPGNITKYLLSKHPEFTIHAIDAAPNMVDLARKNNPTANFSTLDCREIATKISSKFDAIVCGFCMPYLNNDECRQLILDCHQLLKPGGLFYFSVIEGDPQKSGFETNSSGTHKMYTYYYQAEFLCSVIKQAGFELAELWRKPYPKQPTKPLDSSGMTFINHLVFIVKKMHMVQH